MKISVITVCLNSECTIERTIQSVIAQNDDNYEYIIIDGESTDKTLEIIEKYRNEIAIVLSEKDAGIYDAMNKGIALASGDVIGIINSDDWYEPGTFEEVRRCFQKTDAEAVYGKMNLIYEDGYQETLIPSNIEKIRYEMAIPHPTVFLKKDVYKRYGAFQLKYNIAADYDFMLKLYIRDVKFEYIDKVLANFRMNGISVRHREKCIEETLIISQKYLIYAPLREREFLKKVIIHRWRSFLFEKIVKEFPHILYEILNEKLGVGADDNIAIFGAGKWGTLISDALLKKGIHPMFFVDNDVQKWGRMEQGIQVLSPEVLRQYKGVLLVMVNGFSRDILGQIEKIGNPTLYCIIWEEIINGLIWREAVLERR